MKPEMQVWESAASVSRKRPLSGNSLLRPKLGVEFDPIRWRRKCKSGTDVGKVDTSSFIFSRAYTDKADFPDYSGENTMI